MMLKPQPYPPIQSGENLVIKSWHCHFFGGTFGHNYDYFISMYIFCISLVYILCYFNVVFKEIRLYLIITFDDKAQVLEVISIWKYSLCLTWRTGNEPLFPVVHLSTAISVIIWAKEYLIENNVSTVRII